jgi:hypothetical protein
MGITPDEFYSKPYKVRAFMLASMTVQLEVEKEERKRLEEGARRGGS